MAKSKDKKASAQTSSRKGTKDAGGASPSKPPGKASDASLPQWPKMAPLVPSSDLHMDVLVPGQILTISNFWTSTLARSYVAFLSSLPLVTTPGRPKRGDAVRVNDRYQVTDAAFANQLWQNTSLKELVERQGSSCSSEDDEGERGGDLWGGEVVGLNPNIRIYRYSAGQFFDQHYDESNNITLPTNPPTKARTTWTLLLYLTSPTTGCMGGETVFYPEPTSTGGTKGKKALTEQPPPIVVDLEVGMALLHKHGNDCLLHEAREVEQGEKWVIRSDLCVRR